MLLELTEILACPACGPPQVMVAVVHDSVGHRVTRGFLACPACDSRFPIDDGAVQLGAPESLESVGSSASSPSLPEGAAMIMGAVLDLAGRSGHLLLGPELAELAAAVAGLAETWEVVSLGTAGSPRGTRSPNVSRIELPDGEALPVLPGRCGAAAMAGDPPPERIRRYAGALGALGRLAILAPGPGAVAAMREAGLAVIASDERVAVASRSS